MTAHPEPLTPPECDLQDFPFMPLHVARLRDSDLAAEASPEACWYAVLLWAASWHQLPAASLPDNEAVLARLLGLGRDVKTFRKHREAAMRGFELCSDGRLYHPVVAEQAVTAWNSKLQQRWRTECARIKKRGQRDKIEYPIPTFEEFMAGVVPETAPDVSLGTTEIVPEDIADCPQGKVVQEIGTGIGRLIEEGSNDPSLSGGKPRRASGSPQKSPVEPLPVGYPDEAAVAEAAAWITEAGVTVDAAAQARRFVNYAATKERHERNWPAAWKGWIEIEIQRAPVAQTIRPASQAPIIWNGPDAVWAACVTAMGEPHTRSYLGRCVWQEVPEPAVVAPSKFVAEKLARAGLGVTVVTARAGRAA